MQRSEQKKATQPRQVVTNHFFPKFPLSTGSRKRKLRALMVSCQGNKSATWAGGMHTSAGPSQHPSGELFLPDHAFLGSRPLMGQWQATGHVVTVNPWCIHLFPSPVSISFLVFCLGGWIIQRNKSVCPSKSFLIWLASLIQGQSCHTVELLQNFMGNCDVKENEPKQLSPNSSKSVLDTRKTSPVPELVVAWRVMCEGR